MSIISTALLSLILLSLLFSTVVCLSCYECEYPNNPITCVKLTKKCAAVPLDAPYWTKTLLSLVGMALTILLASA
ncbi:hypothetical protein C0J45_9869 [Silurus meridionalis]|nr:hypothetical protein C0J45_9869 [Silurus meridionalis]